MCTVRRASSWISVLALLLLVIPIRDAINALLSIRKHIQSDEKHFAEAFRRECKATPAINVLQNLLIDSEVKLEQLQGSDSAVHLLQFAAAWGKKDLIDWLIDHHVDVDAQGRTSPEDRYNIYNY